MLIWRGRGGLVVLITVLSMAAANILAYLLGGKGYWDSHDWIPGLALIVSGIFIYMLYRLTDLSVKDLVDNKTGQRFVFSPKHDLFWIPLKWWSVIIGSFGIIVVIRSLLHMYRG